MRDIDIRTVLHSYLQKENYPLNDTIIIDEFDICSGLSRVDVAVINGSIHGYEIKSEVDTLNRLPSQIKYYNKSLEKITIAANSTHLDKIKNIVPDWWGLILVNDNTAEEISEIRTAGFNPLLEKEIMLQLLWREELLIIIDKYNLAIKKGWNKSKLQVFIAEELSADSILNEVRYSLKSRKNWRRCSTVNVI